MNEHNNQSVNTSSLKDSVLERIECENICPRSKWVIVACESSLWLLFVLSVLFGALAVAVSTYVFAHMHFGVYEASHESYFTFAVEFIPYAWLTIFGLMLAASYYNFRCTKGGYRQSLVKVVLASITLSLFGGVLLHFVGIGHYLDRELALMMPRYQSMEAKEMTLWLNPDDGRLVGVVSRRYATSADMVRFTDMSHNIWVITTEDLGESDRALLDTDQKLRVVGFLRAVGHFHACGVFPWMYETNMSIRELAEDRKQFLGRMYQQKDNPYERALAFEEFTYATSTMLMGSCAELAVIKRVEESMDN